MLTGILIALQLVLSLVMVVYFYRALKAQPAKKQPVTVQKSDMQKITKMRAIQLTQPLNESVRPKSLSDIIGQEEGIRALRAILGGKNPQHVIIYGPPGIGKTCAARLVLEVVKDTQASPFQKNAPFIEVDATCVRFDERAIADPLIGSVHDPIYQGAGQLGVMGVPQPKPGAVSRAHGGVLFLDEIGELHPIQMNKLLKVLEDRRVLFDSAYYNEDDANVPQYIHDVFKNGYPADFRLVGATTRSPQDIAPALRSRCMEIFFRALSPREVSRIAESAAQRAGFSLEGGTADLVGHYAGSGRDAVNIVQMGAGLAQMESRRVIQKKDIEWVADCCHYSAQASQTVGEDKVGTVHGLAVYGTHMGAILPIEAVASKGNGLFSITGIVEEETFGGSAHQLKRKSTAQGAVECVKTALKRRGIALDEYDIHLHVPGGTAVDGPSAGIAMAVAVWSAVTGQKVDGALCMTGEISPLGYVKAVGGVPSKLDAARRAGFTRALVPKENIDAQEMRGALSIIPISTLEEALAYVIAGARQVQPKREGLTRETNPALNVARPQL